LFSLAFFNLVLTFHSKQNFIRKNIITTTIRFFQNSLKFSKVTINILSKRLTFETSSNFYSNLPAIEYRNVLSNQFLKHNEALFGPTAESTELLFAGLQPEVLREASTKRQQQHRTAPEAVHRTDH